MRDRGIFSNVKQGLSVSGSLAADTNIWPQLHERVSSRHACGGLVSVVYRGGCYNTGVNFAFSSQDAEARTAEATLLLKGKRTIRGRAAAGGAAGAGVCVAALASRAGVQGRTCCSWTCGRLTAPTLGKRWSCFYLMITRWKLDLGHDMNTNRRLFFFSLEETWGS